MTLDVTRKMKMQFWQGLPRARLDMQSNELSGNYFDENGIQGISGPCPPWVILRREKAIFEWPSVWEKAHSQSFYRPLRSGLSYFWS